jgi:hypothetical protein
MGLKLLVLILIIAAVWYGFKLLARRNQNVGRRQPPGQIGSGKREAADEATQDMESCTVCGTFVPNAAAKGCGRDACPYPD